MADIDVTERIEARDKPKPPAWPKSGTPEFEARLAKMRAGHAARRARLEAQKRQPDPEAPPELIDVGEPAQVRMEADPKPAPKGKPGRPRKAEEFDEPTIREYVTLGLDCLASLPGHEHWHRDQEQVKLISVPGTRCLNRMDKALLERLRAVSDPAALIFGCVMVLGPSIVQEVQHVQTSRVSGRQPARPAAHQQQRPAEQAEQGSGGAYRADTAAVSSNGLAHPTQVEGIPVIGL